VCEWAVTLNGNNWSPGVGPRLVETGDRDWLGIFSGDCNPRGNVLADGTPDGDLFECLIQNIHLEAHSDPHPNAALRINVDAPTDTARPPKNAEIIVTSADGRTQSTNLQVAQEMRNADGSRCAGLGATVCTGDVGVLVNTSRTSSTASFVVRVGSVPKGYTTAFSDGCSGAHNGMSTTLIQIGVGERHSCHITFTPPARHGG
jgi:hypothetical protein